MKAKIIILKKNLDKRGFFKEIFNEKFLKTKIGINFKVKQINISNSKKGVIRGLHFQKPKPQAKIIYVLSGKIYDVVVDLRGKSNNNLKYKSFYLSASDNKILYVPKGYAHGFLSLAENTTVCYFVNEFWSKKDEKVISWNDKSINIDWPNIKNLEVLTSKKDNDVK